MALYFVLVTVALLCTPDFTVGQGVCENKYHGFCYVKQQSMNWHDAETSCINQGGHLVDIADTNEENFVRSLTDNEAVYIGINDREYESRFTWVGYSTPSAVFNWYSGEEPANVNHSERYRCAESMDGQWSIYTCDSIDDDYMCKLPQPSSCSGVWYNNDCYLIIQEYKTFEAAEADCIVRGGHLADFQSQAAMNATLNYLIDAGGYIWIGLNDKEYEAKWVWAGKTPQANYVNWGPGEPNGEHGTDCVVIRPAIDLDWDDVLCSSMFPSICKLPIAKQDVNVYIMIDVSASVKDHLQKMTSFVSSFVDITSSDNFFDQYSQHVTVMPFDNSINTHEEWTLDYKTFASADALRASEKNNMANYISNIEAKEYTLHTVELNPEVSEVTSQNPVTLTNIGQSITDLLTHSNPSDAMMIIIVSDFINMIENPELPGVMNTVDGAGVHTFPVIIDKEIRHENTYESIRSRSKDNVGVDLEVEAISASRIEEFYSKM